MAFDLRFSDHLAPKVSKHAAVRAQQRSIPRAAQEALLDWGDCQSAGKEALSCSFSKRSWRGFTEYQVEAAKHFERYRNAYLVAAHDGTIFTVCWRH